MLERAEQLMFVALLLLLGIMIAIVVNGFVYYEIKKGIFNRVEFDAWGERIVLEGSVIIHCSNQVNITWPPKTEVVVYQDGLDNCKVEER